MIEKAIRSLFTAMQRSHLDTRGIIAAEWWAHMRAATDPHQLHFDLDESRIATGRENYCLVHPVSFPSLS